MSTFRLLLRGFRHYWRSNLAVMLGVIAGTAVIGGALVVGDSVRGSLRAMSLARLGRIDHLLAAGRFIREDLADELQRDVGFKDRFTHSAPALVMEGSLNHSSGNAINRASRVQIFGVDQRLWDLTDHGSVAVPSGREIILSRRVADQLQAGPGDNVVLWVELPTSIPRDSLLGNRDETSREISLTVKTVLEETSGVGRLAWNPNQQLPLNAFVALDTLQTNLDLAEVRPSRRKPHGEPARVNALFVEAKSADDKTGMDAVATASVLTDLLSRKSTFQDLNLRLVKNEARGYLSLESEQQILPAAFGEAGRQTAEHLGLTQSPVLVYLVNEMASENDPQNYSAYSVIAGLDLAKLSEPPFGPFTFSEGGPDIPLGPEETILNNWLAKDLQVGTGDRVRIRYHLVGSHGDLPEQERTFTVRGVVQLAESPAADPGLVPVVEGITDAETFDDWDQPFEMDLDRVTRRDEDYWEQYRATPKAFVSLDVAQHLWQSRYGDLTSLRVSPLPGRTLDETADEFTTSLLNTLTAEQTGLVFQPVKYQGVQAAAGTTDFSGLFIGFSFFLIFSATILIGLLFRLGIERRGASVGLLAAVGFTPQRIRRLFFTEGLLVVTIGGLIGSAAAVGYASLMVHGLKTWWISAIGTRFLDVYVTPVALVSGFAVSVGVAVIAIWWALRLLRLMTARELLAGSTEPEATSATRTRRGRRTSLVGSGSVLAGLVLLVAALTGLIPDSEAFSGLSWQVVTFFVVGIALLSAGLSFLLLWLDSNRTNAVRGAGAAGLGRLALRNAARHRQRSVFTVGLIASATFVIVAVGAGRRNPAVERPEKSSGNGGFTLIAESSTPIIPDLNSADGRDKLDIGGSDSDEDRRLLDAMQVMPFRLRPGENASCLNLYHTRRPTILGVPQRMVERGGFKFADTKSAAPWELLNQTTSDGTIPVLGDMNTLMYSLKKGIGDVIEVDNGGNSNSKFKVVGMFDGSVFQGVLLMSEQDFLKLYPDESYRYFLVECPLEDAERLSKLLETGLAAYGFDAEPVADRLANFLAVQNTYLSTFQTLGGLGLLLGTFGLATVMLRNVVERRSELALLRAVGFEERDVAWLVLWENAFLLIWGLAAGSSAALLAMIPHLTSIGADVPWVPLLLTLAVVFVIGMLAAFVAVAEAVRTPILAGLRSE